MLYSFSLHINCVHSRTFSKLSEHGWLIKVATLLPLGASNYTSGHFGSDVWNGSCYSLLIYFGQSTVVVFGP